MSYCQISDVCADFPRFVRDSPGSVQDSAIQSWIDNAAARIDAALINRGIAPAATTLTADQQNWLRSLNLDAAVGRMGLVLEAQVTLQPGEVSLAGQRLKQFETTLNEVRNGRYDWFFGLQSRLRDPNAFAGADTDRSTPRERGENRAFGVNEDY